MCGYGRDTGIFQLLCVFQNNIILYYFVYLGDDLKKNIKIILLSLFILSSHTLAYVGHDDFSNLSFTEAFDSLYINFSICYPFSDWKAIDWQGLYNEYAPQINAAQNSNDTSAYKLAIRHFIHSFPDGHVRVKGDFQNIFFGEIGGGFGLTLIEFDDGSIVVNRILSGNPAESAGIEIGAVIVDWNGLPVNESLQQTNLIWEGKPPATGEATRLSQLRRLVRMSVGTQIEITFVNPGQNPVTQNLSAVDDGMETWDLTSYTKFSTNGSVNLTFDDIFNPVQYEILESGYGYLKNTILVEFDSLGNLIGTYENIYHSIKEAIDAFNTAQVPGVIVDIRDNPGGFDRLAALFGSFFYDHTELYEQASFYNPETGQFEIIESFSIYLEPQVSYYGGPVICLVNAGTSSSAEGVAMAVHRLSQGDVLGFYGTHGSFALTSGETLMPADLAVSYPLGRSLDENETIQIDSDSNKVGGVIPDIRVPLNSETMQNTFVEGVDVELEFAVDYLNNILSIESSTEHAVSLHYTLKQNYPNPFNPVTTIRFDLPEQSHVTLTIYDILGREIRKLTNTTQDAGYKSVIWDGTDEFGRSVGTGIYLYQIKAGNFTQTRKMLLLR